MHLEHMYLCTTVCSYRGRKDGRLWHSLMNLYLHYNKPILETHFYMKFWMTTPHVLYISGFVLMKGWPLDRRRSTFQPLGWNRGRFWTRFEFRAKRQDMFNHARQIVTQCFVLPSHRTVWQNFSHCVAKFFQEGFLEKDLTNKTPKWMLMSPCNTFHR